MCKERGLINIIYLTKQKKKLIRLCHIHFMDLLSANRHNHLSHEADCVVSMPHRGS